jgi:hypothetical protein
MVVQKIGETSHHNYLLNSGRFNTTLWGWPLQLHSK